LNLSPLPRRGKLDEERESRRYELDPEFCLFARSSIKIVGHPVSLLTVVDIVGLNWAVPALRSNADGSAGLGSTPESQDDEFPAVNSMARLRRPMGTLDKSEVAAAWKWVNYMVEW
jgi:hypothetical protein